MTFIRGGSKFNQGTLQNIRSNLYYFIIHWINVRFVTEVRGL